MLAFFGGRGFDGQAVVLMLRDGFACLLPACHDVWQFGRGTLDWTKHEGRQQLALAMAMEATQSVSVATLWCQDIALHLLTPIADRDAWVLLGDDITQFIVQSLENELFGARPGPIATAKREEVSK